jgi:protein SCO1/2
MLSRVLALPRWSRVVGRGWFWLALVLAVMALPVGRALFRRLPPMLPVLGEAPSFSLLDQRGESFGSRDLAGRAWLLAVLSPSGDEGDLIGDKLARIQHRAHHLGADFHVVSITIDPERDSPADLAIFLRTHHGSPRMWTFLTGDRQMVADLLARLSAWHVAPPGFVLVDARQRVRAVYDARDADVVERVLFELGLLVNRGG